MLSQYFAFTASQRGPLARPPKGTRLRGPAGSLRCSAWQGPAELGSVSLKQAAVLFPANPVLLARVNGTNPGAHSIIGALGNCVAKALVAERKTAAKTHKKGLASEASDC